MHWPLTRSELQFLTLMLLFWGFAADITSRWAARCTRWWWTWSILQLAMWLAAIAAYVLLLRSNS